jgi:hypothetical protein
LSFRKTNRGTLAVVTTLLMIVGSAWAQSDDGAQPPSSETLPAGINQQSEPTQPASSPQPPPYVLNAPIVGLNIPLRIIGGETRSFLLPGAQLSVGGATDQRDGFGPSDTYATVRGLGSLSFQRLWKQYNFGADYIGGAAYLGQRSPDWALLQSINVDQHIAWSTGQVTIRDEFSYLPEGNFGLSAYGGSASLSGLNGGFTGLGGGIFGPGQLASLGHQPRLNNELVGEVVQYLSPRSSIGAGVSYGLVHFIGGKFDLINNWQVSAQASYDYQISRRNQVAVLYAHQTFQYPSSVGNDIDANLVNVLFGHRQSGRLEFIAGAGPQFTHIVSPFFGPIDRVTVSGRASLKYQRRETGIALSFLRYTSNGSGFFPGANTDIVRLVASRPLGRLWGAQLDIGYNHNTRLAPTSTASPRTFDYVFAGAGVHRQLSREFSAFASFQFSNTNFDAPFCLTVSSCGRTSQREVGLVGLDWHPHPIPMD